MIVHDTATTFITLIDTAVLWVQALAAAAVFVLCVAGVCAVPLIAPRSRTGRRTPPVRRPVPSWARTQPRDYDPAA